MRSLHAVILLTSLLAGQAQANDEPEDLRHQIEELVARNAWSGADRLYRALVNDGVRLDPADHFRGARAAMALGKINAAVERCERAKKHTEAQTLLSQIGLGYGQVKLAVPRSHDGGVPLRSTEAMIDPLHRAVVQAAKQALETDGSYKGLLPLGGYKLGQTRFEVILDKPAKAKFE